KGMKKELEDLRKEQEKGAKEESHTQWLARRMRERSREMTDEQRDVMQKVGIGLGINSPAARFPSIVSNVKHFTEQSLYRFKILSDALSKIIPIAIEKSLGHDISASVDAVLTSHPLVCVCLVGRKNNHENDPDLLFYSFATSLLTIGNNFFDNDTATKSFIPVEMFS
ncbi:hypothetical protein ADUPG1_001933, partial [Aduncisulcus paluster]